MLLGGCTRAAVPTKPKTVPLYLVDRIRSKNIKTQSTKDALFSG